MIRGSRFTLVRHTSFLLSRYFDNDRTGIHLYSQLCLIRHTQIKDKDAYTWVFLARASLAPPPWPPFSSLYSGLLVSHERTKILVQRPCQLWATTWQCLCGFLAWSYFFIGNFDANVLVFLFFKLLFFVVLVCMGCDCHAPTISSFVSPVWYIPI